MVTETTSKEEEEELKNTLVAISSLKLLALASGINTSK